MVELSGHFSKTTEEQNYTINKLGQESSNKIERKGQRRGPSVKRAKSKKKLPIRNKQETRTPAPNY